MIKLIALKLDLGLCESQLSEYKNLLDDNEEINEGKDDGLLAFFAERPQLILLAGTWIFGMNPEFYQKEFNVFNEFRADFAVSNKNKNKYVFIEFENACKESIFKSKENSGSIRYEWSTRFEHGYSQVVDWYYRMDDLERTNKFKEHFGTDIDEYFGLLVIGRDKFISESGCETRYKWRKEKTLINNRHLYYMTFDRLYAEMKEKLTTLEALKDGLLG